MISAGSDLYVFDADGFLTDRVSVTGATTYDYSLRGELLSVALEDGRIITYDHDPFGRRIAKIIDGTVTEKYLWQDNTTLLAVYDASDNLIERFNYADGRLPVSMLRGGSTYYMMYDQVGSLRLIIDSTGNIIKRVDYDSFGNIINDTNPGFTVPFCFAGGLHDRDTGLVRFGARDFDPTIGRWTAKDPIDFAGGDVNLYGYVQNNPVNFVDPFGLWTFSGGFGLGYAVKIKVGYNSNRWTIGFGVGEGVGLVGSIDLSNKPPSSADSGIATQIGVSISAGIKILSKSLGIGGAANVRGDSCDNYLNKVGFSFSIPGPKNSSLGGGTFEIGQKGNLNNVEYSDHYKFSPDTSIGFGAFQFAGFEAEVSW